MSRIEENELARTIRRNGHRDHDAGQLSIYIMGGVDYALETIVSAETGEVSYYVYAPLTQDRVKALLANLSESA